MKYKNDSYHLCDEFNILVVQVDLPLRAETLRL